MEGKAKKAEARAEAAEKKAEEAEARLDKAETAFSRFMEKVSAWVESHHGLERILRAAVRLSESNRAKIERRKEETVKRGERAIQAATETVEGLLAAEDELERGKRDFDTLKTAAKKDWDIDELEGGWDYDD